MKAVESYHDLVRQDALAMLPQSVGNVLDFGGGVGATVASLRSAGRASHAVLFDQVAENAAPGVDVAESIDLEDTPAVKGLLDRHGPFDTVLCLDILEHLRDPWAVVATIEPALAPGGALLVSVPNVNCYAFVLPLFFKGRLEYVDAGILDRTHLRWFTRDSAIALTLGNGLKLETVGTNRLRRRDRLINGLTLGLLKRFLVHQHLVLVRKPG